MKIRNGFSIEKKITRLEKKRFIIKNYFHLQDLFLGWISQV